MRPQKMLIERLNDASLSHKERVLIGQKLAEFGDPRRGVGVKDGVPDIAWVCIPGGKVRLERIDHDFNVEPFRMAKYPVTNAQFEAFIKAEDGYKNKEWWKDIKLSKQASMATWEEANSPPCQRALA